MQKSFSQLFDPKYCAKSRGLKSCKQCSDRDTCKAAILLTSKK
jgi:hypothetical protein